MGTIDAIVAFDGRTGKTYWLPPSMAQLTTVSLRLATPKNGQVAGIIWADQFEDW
jgi:hypothetical protein